jgi:gamma-glutamyl-gamma-aminobutyrate hydrolase PuuD
MCSLLACTPSGSGRPLSHRVRGALEAYFEADFSAVRVHVGPAAPALGGRAFAHGERLFFAPGAFDPDSPRGLWLLGHELAHVVQQREGRVPPLPGVVTLPELEAEADLLGAAAAGFLRLSRQDVRRLCLPLPSSRVPDQGLPRTLPVHGPVQLYPLVKDNDNLPTDAAGWIKRFHAHGRQEPEVVRVLEHFEAKKMTFDSEKELVLLARMVISFLRRPKLGGRPVVVAIPYRGDGRGKAIVADVGLVTQGTECEVIVLLPAVCGKNGLLDKSVLTIITDLDSQGVKCAVVLPKATLKSLRVDALYISGGPHDHPNTKGYGRPRDAGNRAQEAWERHLFEERLIQDAAKFNIPVLGICGGSWRLASTKGAMIKRLPHKQEKIHAGPMNEPKVLRHPVVIQPLTMLHEILRTDNYRNNWLCRPQVKWKPLALEVNSVHWASSVFPKESPFPSAYDDDVVEAFEDSDQHFSVGIQWHPEYAQEIEGIVGELHKRILMALGDAAVDGRAARTIQRAWRRRRAAKKGKDQKKGDS